MFLHFTDKDIFSDVLKACEHYSLYFRNASLNLLHKLLQLIT